MNTKKIVIFYSSIGGGHLSAAQAIQRDILALDPNASVILQNIRAFMNPVWRKIDENLYWFIASNLPNTFDVLFDSAQTKGKRVSSLSYLPHDYHEKKLLAFLQTCSPDVILTTHYGSAQVLGILRERSLFPDMMIGWLHTDFFAGYLPRISQLIDHTFLAHPELEKQWLAAGVPQNKISTSGMPIQIPYDDKETQQKLRQQLGLHPDIPTIVISTGKEGMGNYRVVIESIADHYQDRIHIVAVCGKNVRQKKRLLKYKKHLPPHVSLETLGFIPHHEMISLMKMAQVLISKAGGITPSEAFSIGLPTVLLDLLSGHERKNAALFVKLGLVRMVSNVRETGKVTAKLLTDPQQLHDMVEAQHNFSKYIDFSKIPEFALNSFPYRPYLSARFGRENGTPVANAHEIIEQLDDEIPGEIEILLSYSTSVLPERISRENPFGHIAIRVGDNVYSAHYKANQNIDRLFLQHLSLVDYLYGTQNHSPTQVHTNTYGMAYGRENIGLRISGISSQRIHAMIGQVDRIEERYKKNILHWNKYTYNCADIVALILQAGGYDPLGLPDKLGLPTMPLDVFEKTLAMFAKDSSLRKNLVIYKKISRAHARYKFSHFPLSLWQPIRSIKYIVRNAHDASDIEIAADKILAVTHDHLFIEDLKPDRGNALFDSYVHPHKIRLYILSACVIDIRQQLQARLRL
jgi:UDP-N-acetylglucosamine:LPS N-acetylglucosamine transferase